MPLHWKFSYKGSKSVLLTDLLDSSNRALNPKLEARSMVIQEAKSMLARTSRTGNGAQDISNSAINALLRSEVRSTCDRPQRGALGWGCTLAVATRIACTQPAGSRHVFIAVLLRVIEYVPMRGTCCQVMTPKSV